MSAGREDHLQAYQEDKQFLRPGSALIRRRVQGALLVRRNVHRHHKPQRPNPAFVNTAAVVALSSRSRRSVQWPSMHTPTLISRRVPTTLGCT